MASKLSVVKSTATQIANEAAKASRAALIIKSPSRVFYAIGEYVVDGFTNALSDGSGSVYKTASGMAEFAKNGFNKAIDKISTVLDGSIDSQPTIRPIMDLSDVESGVNTMNGMFGMNPSVGVMSNIKSISSMMSGRNQNGTNDDVISAIDRLRKELGNITNGNTYNINGITYDNGSAVSEAISTLVRYVKIEGRA